ncbi:MAG TPA: hypothetical protein VGT08_04350 [Terracidiphilus sp.]|nr:hypothetical protein [Terracidiphilus sp.]
MKLRIKENSLRFRVSRADLSRLMQIGRIDETIRFAPEKEATLTYALESSRDQKEMSVRYRPQEVTVLLPLEDAHRWFSGDEVGLYFDYHVRQGMLTLIVEKDFACLDRSDADNEDTFPNPNHGAVC